jgi:hypothetical protein
MSFGRWTSFATGLLLAVAEIGTAEAANNFLFAMDGNFVMNRGEDPSQKDGWGGFGRFSYANTISPGSIAPYESWRIQEPGANGSGTAINFYANALVTPGDTIYNGPVANPSAAYLPLLDTGTFGTSFDDNSAYTAELKYKPFGFDASGNGTTANQATTLQLIIDKSDGFNPSGTRMGHQVGYIFPRLDQYYAQEKLAGRLDSQGFATIRNNAGAFDEEDGWVPGTLDDAVFHSQSQMNGTAGGGLPPFDPYPALDPEGAVGPHGTDFGAFNLDGPLKTPKGAIQYVLQTVNFGQAAPDNPVDDWEIKSLVVKKVNPDPTEIVRMDARTGFSQRYGSGFELEQNSFQNGVTVNGVEYYPQYTNQIQRFNQSGFLPAMIINPDDSTTASGVAIWQPADYNVFDGTQATMEIRAKLINPVAANQSITLVAKDKDGNDTSGNFGGDEYQYTFNMSTALSTGGQAGLSTSEFRTFQIPLTSFTALVNGAFEYANPGDGLLTDFNLYYMGFSIPAGSQLLDMELEYLRITMPETGIPGDFDGDDDVDGRDFLVWQRNPSVGNLSDWQLNYGTSAPLAASTSVPEPSGLFLAVMGLSAMAVRRRHSA